MRMTDQRIRIRDRFLEHLGCEGNTLSGREVRRIFNGGHGYVAARKLDQVINNLILESVIVAVPGEGGRDVLYVGRQSNPPCGRCGSTGNGPGRFAMSSNYKIADPVCADCKRSLRMTERARRKRRASGAGAGRGRGPKAGADKAFDPGPDGVDRPDGADADRLTPVDVEWDGLKPEHMEEYQKVRDRIFATGGRRLPAPGRHTRVYRDARRDFGHRGRTYEL